MKNEMEEFKTEVAKACLRNYPVRAYIYYPKKILEAYGMGQYASVMMNRVFSADVAEWVLGDHVYIHNGGIALDYLGLLAFEDILEGYIGSEAMKSVKNQAKSQNDLLRSAEVCVNVLRNLDLKELAKFTTKGLEKDLSNMGVLNVSEILDMIVYWRNAELMGRFPLVKLWFLIVQKIQKTGIKAAVYLGVY